MPPINKWKNVRTASLTIALSLLLVGCPGGGSGDKETGSFCASFAGSQLTTNCAGCKISNEQAAIDGNLETPADVTLLIVQSSGGAFTATLRATAQSGMVFPAGNSAGAFLTDHTSCSPCGVVINTYLNGQPQESGAATAPGDRTDVNGNGSPAEFYVGVKTTKPFDAVEVVDSGSGNTVVGPNGEILQVYEICSEGGVR